MKNVEKIHFKRAIRRILGLKFLEWSSEAENLLNFWMKRSLLGEPLARMEGKKAFWNHEFFINSWTLEPRPETEGLVELCIQHFENPSLNSVLKRSNLSILDLGTGSGCILLSLLAHWAESQGIGIDKEFRVFEVARRNADLLNLSDRVMWVESDFKTIDFPEKTFDLIVSNPPYIASKEIPFLSKEVRQYDPFLALDGGLDGLEAYRVLIPKILPWIRPGGLAAFEIGSMQGKDLLNFVRPYAPSVLIRKDLFGLDRYMMI